MSLRDQGRPFYSHLLQEARTSGCLTPRAVAWAGIHPTAIRDLAEPRKMGIPQEKQEAGAPGQWGKERGGE